VFEVGEGERSIKTKDGGYYAGKGGVSARGVDLTEYRKGTWPKGRSEKTMGGGYYTGKGGVSARGVDLTGRNELQEDMIEPLIPNPYDIMDMIVNNDYLFALSFGSMFGLGSFIMARNPNIPVQLLKAISSGINRSAELSIQSTEAIIPG